MLEDPFCQIRTHIQVRRVWSTIYKKFKNSPGHSELLPKQSRNLQEQFLKTVIN